MGVLFDSKLTFNDQVVQRINKAYQILGYIMSSRASLEIKLFIVLYESLVRCHLENALVVWSPYYSVYKNV